MSKHKLKKVLKKLSVSALSISMIFSNMAGFYAGIETKEVKAFASTNYELVDDVQDAAILHCWNWSYSTIEQHLELIAECGYSAIQTSPATQPKDYEWEGVVDSDVGTPGIGGSGNWWKVYQPVTISVCNNGQTWFGTKEELESLCAKAEEYGIKVIVDVVANHMGNISGWKNSLSDVSPEVGEFWNPDMLTDESFWHINDLQVWMSDGREDITQGSMGMPDLNTGDSRVQQYFKDYLIELIDCGVDGFRFDAAKHIETPDDDSSYASDFWPNVLNPAESYYTQKTGGDLYVYGEILNTVGDNFNISSYTKYMSVTDNSAGNQCLDSFRNNQIGNISMHHPVNSSVLWAESHDTYMNEASRYGSDKSIVRTWSYVANKNGAAALFFVRPYYSKDTLVNDVDGSFRSDLATSLEQAQMGECSTYTWASNEVAAINHFRNRMNGKSETYGTSGNIGFCKRGNGIILVNMDGAGSVSLGSQGLSNGTYTDEVSGNTFTVSGGTLSGTIGSEYGIAVIYQNVMSNPSSNRPVQLSSSVANGSIYYTNGLELTLTAKNATSASYSASTGESGTFSDSKTITIGTGLSDGQTVTLTVKGTNSYGTVTQTYTFTKQSQSVVISSDKKDGSKFYTDGVDVTIEALYADSASYSATTGEKGSFTGTTTVNIGAGLSDGETVTLTVTGTNAKGTVTETFTYTKSDNALSTTVLFKNTAGWSTVNAYAWNSSSDKIGSWPGVAMTVFDESQSIYMIEFDTANQYENIIFNNGSTQTADLVIPGMGYIYDYSTSKWSEYELPVNPSISTTLSSGEVDGPTSVTYTVTDATSATYSLNGGSAVSFTGSVTLTVGKNETDKVVITATNSTGTTTKIYTYTCEQEEELTASLKVNGSSSAVSLTVGNSVTVVPTATGGSGSYTYKYVIKNVSTGATAILKSYSSETTYTGTMTSAGTKQFIVYVKDSNGTEVCTNAVTVVTSKEAEELSATLKVNNSSSTINLTVGDTVTVKPTVTGGSGSYTYKYVIKNVSTGATATLKNYSSTTSYTGTMTSAGTKQFIVYVKDSDGTIVTTNAVTVVTSKEVEELSATLKVNNSSSTINLTVGDTVTVKPTATGGSGSYTYKYVIKNVSTGATATLKNYSSTTSYTGTMTSVGTKQFIVYVKDSNGTVVQTNAVTVVTSEESNELSATLKVNNTTSQLDLAVGDVVVLKPIVTGGSGSYTYKYVVKNVATGSEYTLKSYSSSTTYTGEMTGTGTKDFIVYVKDSNGTVVATNSVRVVVE